MNRFAPRMLLLLASWASFALHAQEAPLPTQPAQPAQAGNIPLAAEPPTAAPDNSALDGRLMYELLLGEFSVIDGAASRGYAIFLDAARRTGDSALYQRAADVALQGRSGDAAMQAIEAWRRAEPKSREANRYLLQTLLALNRTAETLAPLRREINATPLAEKPIAILSIPQLYARSSEKELAAQVVESALSGSTASAEKPVAAAAWATIGRMRLLAQDAPGALEAARASQRQSPQAEGAALLALELSSSDGQRANALALLERYLQAPGAQPEIRLDYARLLLQDRRLDEARKQLMQVVQTPAANPAPNTSNPALPSATEEAWLLLGLLDMEQKDPAGAESSLRKYLTLSQDQAGNERRDATRRQAYLALAQIAENRDDYAGADQWLSQIDDAQAAPDTLMRRASLLARQNRLDEALNLIQQAPLPETPSPQAADRIRTLATIQLLRGNGRPQDAYTRLAQFNKAAVQDDSADPNLLYDQAMLADEIGRDGEVEPLLRQVIALAPGNAHAYNALGYFFAERNERLPEARALIQKALELAPDDPFITDSMGWVEFRQGNFAEAVRLLQKAYGIRPDAEIATHLGEVLWQSGRQDDARTAWRDAQRLAPSLPALRDTLLRLGVGAL